MEVLKQFSLIVNWKSNQPKTHRINDISGLINNPEMLI